MTIWYILCQFGTFFPVLVSLTIKNLATLVYISIFRAEIATTKPKSCANGAKNVFLFFFSADSARTAKKQKKVFDAEMKKSVGSEM
jgi:hypothetical protein